MKKNPQIKLVEPVAGKATVKKTDNPSGNLTFRKESQKDPQKLPLLKDEKQFKGSVTPLEIKKSGKYKKPEKLPKPVVSAANRQILYVTADRQKINYSPDGTVIDEQYLDDYAVVYEFCVNYLEMVSVPTTDNTNTGACLNYYGPAKQAFNGLTTSQKQIFLSSQDFSEMVDRMCAWAAANGETFDTTLGGFSSNQTPNIMNNNIAIWMIAVSIMVLSSFAIIFVIRRKRHN